MRFTQVFVFLFCLALSQTGLSSKIYLEYNSDCMDIYEYHYNGNTSGMGHMVYHIALNDMEKVVLEVGVEAKLNQPRKPSNTTTCNRLSLNERVVRQINNGQVELYIVRKDGRGYNVSPVGIASYVQINGKSTGYSTLDTRFSYNFSQPANGINIATNGSDAKVFYKGVVSNNCPKEYLFNKTRQKGGRSYSEFVIIPEIGVIEEKNGFNPTDAQNSVLRLTKVNGQNLEQYLDDYCNDDYAGSNKGFYISGSFGNTDKHMGGKKPSLADLESGKKPPFGTKPPFGAKYTTPDDNRNNRNNNNRDRDRNNTTTVTTDPISTATCSVYKDIDRGVYMDWNTGEVANTECGGNTYVNGRMVGETVGTTIVTTTTPPPPPTTTTAPPTTRPIYSSSNCSEVSTYGKHVVQKSETLYGIARLYGLTLSQIRSYNPSLRGNLIYPCMSLHTKSTTGGDNSVVGTDYSANHHRVQRGETVYQLASKYGYTVDRFRKMNNLSVNSMIYDGQILKTQDCNCPTTATNDVATNFVPREFNATGGRIDTEKGASVNVKRRFHVVKEDDTIYSISRQFNISVDRLRKINDLEENEIIIPFQRVYLEN